MKELMMPRIYQKTTLIGYGGDQEWFHNEWAIKAGCASVLASNLYAYYHQQEAYQKVDFLKVMEDMFELMTPGRMGYPFLYKFAHTFVSMMEEADIHLIPIYQKKSKSYEDAIHFVKKSIDENHPVGMLILHHRAKELEDDNWHWVCISGYKESGNHYQIIFSDCGQRRLIDARILFDIHYSNVFKMVRFKKG